jgi:hypothetical protein
MEVGMISINAQTAMNQTGGTLSLKNESTNVVIPFAKEKPAPEEKTMMDLRDVQNFLYMLIGSEIKVESDQNSIGNTVNAVA